MSPSRRGRLVVISGPSGAGKTSICNELLARLPNACWSISVTTRAARAGEVPGQHYNFVNREQFDRLIADNALLEHAEYLGQLYGTPRDPVETAIACGKIVILEIDVQGAAQVAKAAPDSLRFFILPPTMETLRARLEGRRTEAEAIQQKRLAEADGEIAFARTSGCYQYFITNDILKDSVDSIVTILQRELERE